MPNLYSVCRTLLTFLTLLCGTGLMCAQKYKVESFRMLANDVTAFVNPVTDLNDDGCALIKVQASPDFVFSTPLGIVKRVDNVGEIWLYIPKGSKKITLKHPEWGVLRDYKFPVKIDSHVSYELRVSEPPSAVITETIPLVTTVHDTLVVTHTDTLLMAVTAKREPLAFLLAPSAGFGGGSKTVSGGLMIAVMRRHGGYAHLLSDFGKTGSTIASCDRIGLVGGQMPYYSGKTRHSFFVMTAGAIHRLSDSAGVFEGIGYGHDNTAWQLAESEGGGFVKNSYHSHSGITLEAGVFLSFKRLTLSASVVSIEGSQWYGAVGIGVIIGKNRRHEQ